MKRNPSSGVPLTVLAIALLAAANRLKGSPAKTSPLKDLKYLSLFSGIGGFELGIESAIPSASCIGYSEICRDSAAIYSYHYPDHTNLGDVHTINWNQLPKYDLLVAGFPCTDLSVASTLRPGGRTHLQGKSSGPGLHTAIQAIWASRPAYFILENVASMTYGDRARITQIITDQLGKTLDANGRQLYPEIYVTRVNSAPMTGHIRS